MIKINRGKCPYPKGLEDENYKHPINKNSLRESANDKCMYCESKISHIDYAHVEHIKPKDITKYPELTYIWENHGYSCPKCNNEKSAKYFEDIPFINPYEEDPSDAIFAHGAFLFPKAGSERGEITIREINLNRVDLIEKREQKIKDLSRALNACHRTSNKILRESALKDLQNEATPDKEYSMIARSFLNSSQ